MHEIDTDSLLKNGTIMTNPGCRQQLFSRPYLTVPHGTRSGDIVLRVLYRLEKIHFNVVNVIPYHYSSQSIYPIIPCLKDNIQDAVI